MSSFTKRLNCIILIDDDQINNYINHTALRSLNISDNIILLKNGHEAFIFLQKYFEEKKAFPELIFLDINMPVLDGFEFLERFNKIYPSQKKPVFIVLTTSTDSRDISRLKDLGVKHFLNKPLTKEKLSQLLEKESHLSKSVISSDQDKKIV